ncbi:MAG: glycosyltransferase family 2 protein [Gemmatimonadaceae bacterium]
MPGTGSPSIAICSPTYNQAQFLVCSVENVLRQTDYADGEVWVSSDDASTDDTASVMTALWARNARVPHHRHEKNLGIAENSSLVLGRPTADVVVRLDSDDVLLPDYVRTLRARLLSYPEAG